MDNETEHEGLPVTFYPCDRCGSPVTAEFA
jgi:hypothetical protein